MKKLFFLVAGLLITAAANTQIQRPKLAVGLVVDQMRWDYFYYYNNEHGNGDLERLLNQGFSFGNTHISYAPTVAAIGRSFVYTGSTPAFTGITGNSFYQDDESACCCEDNTVESVDSDSKEGQMNPRHMLTSTIGDKLQVATDFHSKVIGIALKDRAPIPPVGHATDAAYWWDTSAGRFVSSTFYMDRLPQWVEDFNAKNRTDPNFDIKGPPQGVTMTFKMTEVALKNKKLGRGKETDMFTVNISLTNIIGYRFSIRGKENHEVYMQLDKDLTWFLKVFDKEVGEGNYLLFLTVDRDAAYNYNYMRGHRTPAGGWDYKQTVKGLNVYLQGRFDISPVMGEDSYQFYLNDSTIETAGKEKQETIDESVEWLKKDPQFLYVPDEEKISETTIPNWIEECMQNGYFRGRSGEIGVVTRPQFFGGKDRPDFRGTQHRQPFSYDTYIPFLLFGWNVKYGASNIETHIVDIAPTACAMLHIQIPNGCVDKTGNQF